MFDYAKRNALTSGTNKQFESRKIRSRERASAFKLGIFVPMCGAAGIWGPSCLAAAQTAVDELNQNEGIDRREVEIITIDAAFEADVDAAVRAQELVEHGVIDAIAGMHISAVRQKLVSTIGGHIPYVYTPIYEGNENTPGVFTIGETPRQQLQPALDYLSQTRKIHRWALIGNDYVWPRVSHALAHKYLAQSGSKVVMETYVPFGKMDVDLLLEKLVDSRCDGVLLSLVGQDTIDFNRAFGRYNLDTSIIRLSGAIEENTLLAIGRKNTKRLFAASSYFSSLNTQNNCAFKERYHSLHGDNAPTLNALGQSLYEGVHFLKEAIQNDGLAMLCSCDHFPQGLAYQSARGGMFYNNNQKKLPVYLARADGHHFDIQKNLF